MTHTLPPKVSASDAVRHRSRYAGALRVAQLSRLREAMPEGVERVIEVVWQAGTDAAGHAVVQGEIRGQGRLMCQGCLQVFDWPIELRSELRLVGSEEEETQALADCEPYRVENDDLPLRDMVEDEVLLALPLIPRCKTCENKYQSEPQGTGPVESGRTNPFAALKSLKF